MSEQAREGTPSSGRAVYRVGQRVMHSNGVWWGPVVGMDGKGRLIVQVGHDRGHYVMAPVGEWSIPPAKPAPEDAP